MRIIDIKDARTNYALTASRTNGDLVLAGSDLSGWVKDQFETDEYEYFYVVKAADVPRVCAALGATDADLLDRVRDLLAPHDTGASTAWKAWLVDHKIPYDFSVWR